MASVQAVVTTGIYCRPGCGARPHARNVREFEFAAGAEAAGYRACFRCRPYRTEPPIGWNGPELVCRAVHLIVDGALDGATEADLAARLGVSGRHLRRLFIEQVGATPGQLARSRRAHFARRLLDDTDLSITNVAYASGFGSIRQMNRTFHEVFRATPSQLRTRRRVSDRLGQDDALSLRLPFEPPLEWNLMLDFVAARAIRGVEEVLDRTYRRTVLIDGVVGVVAIEPGGADHLIMRAHLPRWEGLIHIVRRVRRIFNLDVDVNGAALALGHDHLIGSLVRARPGLRPPGAWDPFEVGVRAILGQQISVAGASTMTSRIVERVGVQAAERGDSRLSHIFPSPEMVAEADLEGLGLTSARVRALHAFAGAAADGSIRWDQGVELDELVASLTALPGIGPWTAQYIALRLGRRDAFPASDLGLRRAVERLSSNGAAKNLGRTAERWRPWRSHAAIQLWTA